MAALEMGVACRSAGVEGEGLSDYGGLGLSGTLSTDEPLECIPKLLVEDGVYDRVQGRVAVAYPEEHREYLVVGLRITHLLHKLTSRNMGIYIYIYIYIYLKDINDI